jgi:hypothetical protein
VVLHTCHQGLGKKECPISKITRAKRTGGVAQAVQILVSPKKKKKNKKTLDIKPIEIQFEELKKKKNEQILRDRRTSLKVLINTSQDFQE